LPSRESAAPHDQNYLLRDLEVTPVRFRLNPRAAPPAAGLDATIAAFVRDHPGATMNDLRTYVPGFGEGPYEAARAVLTRLVSTRILVLDGQVPLEELDLRYERVACCDVCGESSATHAVVFWKHNTPVVRCAGCGLLYANPRWKAEYLFGRYTDDYWELYRDKVSATATDPVANQARWDPVLTDLAQALPAGRILDVGCATGEFLLAAQARGWAIQGLESSPIGAEQARQTTSGPIYCGTLEIAPYEDASLDVVTLWDVIEHLQSPRAYLERIARLIRPGGLFALTTPNIRSLPYALLGRDWEIVGPNDHLYYFAPRTLARLLARTGFAIHSMRTQTSGATVWRQWLRRPALQGLAPGLHAVTWPVLDRLLLGDELYVIARRRED